MSILWEHVSWDDPRSMNEMAVRANERGVGYLLLSPSVGTVPEAVVESSIRQSSADVLVFVDPRHPARMPRRREFLPPIISLIAASPQQDQAVALSVQTLSKSDGIDRSQTWAEVVVKVAGTAAVTFVEVPHPQHVAHTAPPLTAPATRPGARWLRDLIPEITVPGAKPTAATALQAGLFLFANLFDESHSRSQSIEGEGRYHTGDYWHAILHRSEPDYGNSKYWFRHVGRHPIFAELKAAVSDLPTTGAKSTQFRQQVRSSSQWDPFAFVDACAAAEDDRDLKGWCEAVQYEEMLLLLEHTCREAMGAE